MKKGQYFSFDAIIASLIFILTIVSLLSYWYSVHAALDYQNYELMKEAIRVSDLVLTPGNPENWGQDRGKINQLGFANSWEDKRLNFSKIQYAAYRCANDVKKKFNSPYNVSIIISQKSIQRSVCIGQCDESKPDLSAAKNIAKITRVASVGSVGDGKYTPATIEVYVFN